MNIEQTEGLMAVTESFEPLSPDEADGAPAADPADLVPLHAMETAEGAEPAVLQPMRRPEVARLFDLGLRETKTITDSLRETNPELFLDEAGVIYCTPEALPFIREMAAELPSGEPAAVDTPGTDRPRVSLLKDPNSKTERERRVQEEVRKRFAGFTEEMNQGETVDAERFKILIGLFGKESAADVLFQYKAEFRDHKFLMPRVKSFLADYLGDVTVQPGELDINHLQEALPLLSNANLQKSLTEVVKRHCMTYYQEKIRANPNQDQFDIVASYLDKIRDDLSALKNQDLESILDAVDTYYLDVFGIEKSDKLVDSLSEGRLFPDITQRITMKETKDKRRFLNGNSTGMGKSASAIMTKEFVGSKCAVIVAPSSVVENGVWQKYLAAHDPETGEGYFKPGQEPRVLVVKGMESLQRVNSADYDYIIISHEKVNLAYTEALKAIDYDMLIVDEEHNFKNLIKGIRPELLLQLAGKIEGPNKHLLLLTATPAPNKVEDIAMTLRLLHPKRFTDYSNEQLVHEIIHGDVLDIRSLLLPYMQNHRIEDFIDIEPANDEIVWVDMTDEQKIAYDVLLEEYELTPSEKLMALRLFCMNPAIFDPTPGLAGGKPAELERQLSQLLAGNDKVLAFINDYVQDILVGDKALLEQIDVPENVAIASIYGDTTKARRRRATNEFIGEDGKMLLMVSGQTVSVGVDLARAGAVVMYNEPWTYSLRRQQIGRAQRPGRDGVLDIVTLVTRNSVEEGIYRYIRAKHAAIEKLIYGIPLTAIEQQVVEAAEKDDDATGIELVNNQLADNYRSKIDRMNKMFALVKGIGEAGLTGSGGFLELHGTEYAENYQDLTQRSYQANVSRVNATLIDRIVQETPEVKRPSIIDIGSGPEMLRRHIDERLADGVISIDINPKQLEDGVGERRVGAMANLPVETASVDVANLALTYHYSAWSLRNQKYERLKVLGELNRVLKTGGSAVITMPYSLDFKNEGSFLAAAQKLGFSVRPDQSGQASMGDTFKARIVTLRKTRDCSQDIPTLLKQMGNGVVEALRIVKQDESSNDKKKTGLKDSRKIISQFEMNGSLVPINFNQADRQAYAEEQAAVSEMQVLQAEHGTIRQIPADVIAAKGFARLFVQKRYILFRKLAQGSGAVVIRDSVTGTDQSAV